MRRKFNLVFVLQVTIKQNELVKLVLIGQKNSLKLDLVVSELVVGSDGENG